MAWVEYKGAEIEVHTEHTEKSVETSVNEEYIEIVQPKFEPYDIPLSTEIQEYTYNLCEERGVEFEIVLAMMFVESTYRADLISKTNDYGIMQINKCNHSWLKEELGITDFLDPYQNINAGTYMIGGHMQKYNDAHKALMAYNFGESGAKEHWSNGVYSSKYSRKIVEKAEEIKELKIGI